MRQHALEDAVAVHEQMLQRRRDVEGDEGSDQARETEVHGAAQLLQGRRIPAPVRQRETEVPDRILGKRRAQVADERLHDEGAIEQEVAGTGGADLPARHRLGQRRWPMADAPGEAKEDQQPDRQADRLVQVEPPGAQTGRGFGQLAHPPAERDLAQHQHRDDPVQRDRHPVVAFSHLQEALFLRSSSSAPRWPPSAAMSAAVLPRLSCAELSAPRSSSSFTAASRP